MLIKFQTVQITGIAARGFSPTAQIRVTKTIYFEELWFVTMAKIQSTVSFSMPVPLQKIRSKGKHLLTIWVKRQKKYQWIAHWFAVS